MQNTYLLFCSELKSWLHLLAKRAISKRVLYTGFSLENLWQTYTKPPFFSIKILQKQCRENSLFLTANSDTKNTKKFFPFDISPLEVTLEYFYGSAPFCGARRSSTGNGTRGICRSPLVKLNKKYSIFLMPIYSLRDEIRCRTLALRWRNSEKRIWSAQRKTSKSRWSFRERKNKIKVVVYSVFSRCPRTGKYARSTNVSAVLRSTIDQYIIICIYF